MAELTNLLALLKERDIIEKKIFDEHQRLMVNISFAAAPIEIKSPIIDVSSCLISSEEELTNKEELTKEDIIMDDQPIIKDPSIKEDSVLKEDSFTKEDSKDPKNIIVVDPKNIIEDPKNDNWCIQRHQRRKLKNNVVKRQNPPTLNEENVPLLINNEPTNISIPAIVVKSFNEVLNDGNMYYVVYANHFAQYINNKLYHGNIGIIYNNEKYPIKIKNCQYHSYDYDPKSGKCNYYHDPFYFTESNDVRNYVSNSWKFIKSTSFNKEFSNKEFSNKENSLLKEKDTVFGSILSIEHDIKDISDDDLSRFMDMTFHNILYSYILSG